MYQLVLKRLFPLKRNHISVIPQEARTGFEPVIRVLQTTGKSAANPYFISILPPSPSGLVHYWYTIRSESLFIVRSSLRDPAVISPNRSAPFVYLFNHSSRHSVYRYPILGASWRMLFHEIKLHTPHQINGYRDFSVSNSSVGITFQKINCLYFFILQQ